MHQHPWHSYKRNQKHLKATSTHSCTENNPQRQVQRLLQAHCFSLPLLPLESGRQTSANTPQKIVIFLCRNSRNQSTHLVSDPLPWHKTINVKKMAQAIAFAFSYCRRRFVTNRTELRQKWLKTHTRTDSHRETQTHTHFYLNLHQQTTWSVYTQRRKTLQTLFSIHPPVVLPRQTNADWRLQTCNTEHSESEEMQQ